MAKGPDRLFEVLRYEGKVPPLASCSRYITVRSTPQRVGGNSFLVWCFRDTACNNWTTNTFGSFSPWPDFPALYSYPRSMKAVQLAEAKGADSEQNLITLCATRHANAHRP